MSPSPPEEPTHFRSNNLSPASPRPLHIPEPQNIPVLQNQIDPYFNLMSTHMAQPSASEPVLAESNAFQQYNSDPSLQAQIFTNLDIRGINHRDYQSVGEAVEGIVSLDHSLPKEGETSEIQEGDHTIQNHMKQSETQDTTALASYATLSAPATHMPTPLPSDEIQTSSAFIQHSANTSDNPQDAFVTQGRDTRSPGPGPGSFILPPKPESDVNSEGVNYQDLLDNLSPTSATAPSAENVSSISTTAPSRTPVPLSPSSLQTPIATLPIPAGLPARPPPQEKPAIHPNYTPGEDIRSYHKPPAQNTNVSNSYQPQPSNPQRPTQGYIHNNGVAPNGLPPPPSATFQQPMPNINQPQRSPQTQQFRHANISGANGGRPVAEPYRGENQYPGRADAERSYDQFLQDEAIYVSEGTWDRFPQGSRLFVGNLFTERVSKRDIFDVFQKYGKLAQISMKSAYGFVQYHNADSCVQAMRNEEGTEIQGRKIHLEVSKPQKNSRNAAATAAGDSLRAGYSRRSRSPDYGRGSSARGANPLSGGARSDRNTMPSNFGRAVRDEYRPVRSPSPRGFRGRDNFRGRERSPARYNQGRSRSPHDRSRQFRSRSPRATANFDDEATLPIMRRNPRDVPDVQIILVDEVDRTFVGYVQQSFRGRGLRCDVLQLPRVSLAAVVKRQIIEGVQAVVKIFQKSQNTGKIPLQVYNRSSGVENVRFDEYEDLDANIAAEIVFRAKSTHMAPAPAPPLTQYSPAYGQTQYARHPQQMPQQYPPQNTAQNMPQQQQQQQQQPQPGGPNTNLANLITSLDGPALQKLLGNMSQTPQTPQTPSLPQHTQNALPQPAQPAHQDLASLLSSVARQQPPQQNYQYGAAPPQQQQNPYPSPVASQGYANHPPQYVNPAGRPPQQSMTPQYSQQSPAPQQNVQGMPPQYQYSHPGPAPQQTAQGITPQYSQPISGGQQNVQDMLAQLAKYRS